MECLPPRTPWCGAAAYRIRVAGVLSASWLERTGGIKVVVQTDPATARTTDLVGTLPAQAALMGIVDRLYTHGARLLGVESLEPGQASLELSGLTDRKEGP